MSDHRTELADRMVEEITGLFVLHERHTGVLGPDGAHAKCTCGWVANEAGKPLTRWAAHRDAVLRDVVERRVQEAAAEGYDRGYVDGHLDPRFGTKSMNPYRAEAVSEPATEPDEEHHLTWASGNLRYHLGRDHDLTVGTECDLDKLNEMHREAHR